MAAPAALMADMSSASGSSIIAVMPTPSRATVAASADSDSEQAEGGEVQAEEEEGGAAEGAGAPLSSPGFRRLRLKNRSACPCDASAACVVSRARFVGGQGRAGGG